MAGPAHTHAAFRSTQWSLLRSLRDPSEAERSKAMDLLTRRYWPAVYAFLRREGRSREDAADLTQGFFADVVVGRRLFEVADPERGSLRALLRTAVKRYNITAHRSDVARPDSNGYSLEALAAEDAFLEREQPIDAADAFERRWATALIEEALARCESSLRASNLHGHWEAFEMRTVRPAIGAVSRPAWEVVAQRTGFASGRHVASAMKVVRKRLELSIREVTAETASSAEAQDAEYELLHRRLS
jgi:DNA-directed RNA polymerase specialized sigma24 family protein